MAVSDNALVVFQGKNIRRTWFNDEWWFSVVDIVEALTETGRARKYWSDLKIKLQDEGFEVSEKVGQLKLAAEDGKLRATDCANTKNMFRIIQAIPSPKAEPFKQWLAEVGYQRVQEIENPELAQKRMRELYKAKGYSDDWIEKRMRGIAIRDELTDKWRKRGVLEDREYAILTAEITKNEDAQGYAAVEGAAKRGGRVAGSARKETEKELGRPVTSRENYLAEPEKKKKISNE
ncbi:Bro-N domain-containing protein [Candidatus Woesearchaeota archaeon]|nr:Bro-N domain-containing protein [Candidatus Woesearchaeota archaeon]